MSFLAHGPHPWPQVWLLKPRFPVGFWQYETQERDRRRRGCVIWISLLLGASYTWSPQFPPMYNHPHPAPSNTSAAFPQRYGHQTHVVPSWKLLESDNLKYSFCSQDLVWPADSHRNYLCFALSIAILLFILHDLFNQFPYSVLSDTIPWVLLHHGWTLQALCSVKWARHQRTNRRYPE